MSCMHVRTVDDQTISAYIDSDDQTISAYIDRPDAFIPAHLAAIQPFEKIMSTKSFVLSSLY
jgi:hypothetical protein